MARYKDYCYEQDKLIPVSFSRQIVPGTSEYTLSHLIDHELDLSAFDACYQNDETGAPAYDPRLLLKIILFAYARGVFSSRRIEQACRENVVFMALSADSQPHWTTTADFTCLLQAGQRPARGDCRVVPGGAAGVRQPGIIGEGAVRHRWL